ncbi:hypothetical protein OG921_04195 [Aldersonia sp. NBC_00410]|nr:hypothetical protein [Aldersonia sp. NBC_00410]MCX5042362.1 hypothetical protein [Aldersonia sp. NBC_00410]MCX5042385.1 hypothetical protein [Aldersonia sp. NBC_00410]
MAEYADAAKRALKHPDPWQGFCSYVETMCSLQAAVRDVGSLLLERWAAA